MPLTASDLLNQRLAGDRAGMERAYKQEQDAVSRRFVGNDPRIAEARQRALSGLYDSYYDKAVKLKGEYDEKFRGLAEVKQMADQGLVAPERVEEIGLRMTVSPDVEKALFPKEDTFAQVDAQRERIRGELSRFDVGRMEGDEFTTKPIGRVKAGRIPLWAGGKAYEPEAKGVFVKEKYWDDEDGKEKTRHRAATQEEMRGRAINLENLKQVDKEASRLQLAALRSNRMLGNGQGTFADKAVRQVREPTVTPESQPRKLDENSARSILSEAGGDKNKARQLARQRGYEF